MAKVFTVVMNKGGSLKTSLTVNIGSQLSKEGKKVLLIDLDEQQNVLLSFRKEPAEFNVFDWVINNKKTDEIKVNVSPNLDIIDGPRSTFEFAEGIKSLDIQNYLLVLKDKIEAIEESYDYILIDTPPTLDFSTALGMSAADELIVPFQPEYYGISSLIKTFNEIMELKNEINPNLKIKRIIPTRFDKRSKYHKQTLLECKEYFDELNITVSKNFIPETKQGINSLFEESKPPILSSKWNKLKSVYKAVTLEITKEDKQ